MKITQILKMDQFLGVNLLLQKSCIPIVPTYYMYPLLLVLSLQLWVIALFQDTIQKVSNAVKQVVSLIALWMAIMTLFRQQL